MYFLIHKGTKERYDDLDVKQVVARILDNNDEQWYVWRKGMKNWLHYKKFDEIIIKLNMELNLNNVEPDTVTVGAFDNFSDDIDPEDYEFDSDGSKIEKTRPEGSEIESEKSSFQNSGSFTMRAFEPSNGKERRQHERHEVSLDTTISYKDLMFETHTENLSWGGIKIAHHLPDELDGKECHILLEDKSIGVSINFTSTIISGGTGKISHIAFLSSDEKGQEQLSYLLDQVAKKKAIKLSS